MAIYFARAEGTNFVKIGFCVSTVRRLAHLQAGCPYKLTIARTCEGDRSTEAAFHSLFAEHHIEREWFRWSPRMEHEAPKPPAIVVSMAGQDGFAALIDEMGGPSAVASKTGIGASNVHKMRYRNRVPAWHWPSFVAAGVPMERLMACQQQRGAA